MLMLAVRMRVAIMIRNSKTSSNSTTNQASNTARIGIRVKLLIYRDTRNTNNILATNNGKNGTSNN